MASFKICRDIDAVTPTEPKSIQRETSLDSLKSPPTPTAINQPPLNLGYLETNIDSPELIQIVAPLGSQETLDSQSIDSGGRSLETSLETRSLETRSADMHYMDSYSVEGTEIVLQDDEVQHFFLFCIFSSPYRLLSLIGPSTKTHTLSYPMVPY